jgi:anti-sigma regulatory factor (Ser/Thr protein kinase)
MAYWLKEKEIAVELVGTESYGYPISYLDDSLFFLEHLGNTLKSGVSPRSTTLPLKRVEHADSHQHVQFTVVPWLSSKILVSESSLATISVCVKELFNNIPDHAQKNSGCMFVQYFPKMERIVIVVSDFGLGIPKVVQTAKPELSDVDAILQAVQEGFTTSSTPRNRGAGLSFILQSVVIRYGGIVTIYSGRGVVSFWKQRGCGLVSRRWRQPTGFCPGTLFEIDLQVANLPSVFEEVGELTWD